MTILANNSEHGCKGEEGTTTDIPGCTESTESSSVQDASGLCWDEEAAMERRSTADTSSASSHQMDKVEDETKEDVLLPAGRLYVAEGAGQECPNEPCLGTNDLVRSRDVAPEENFISINTMMDQFKGREDELIDALRSMQKRVVEAAQQKASSIGNNKANQATIAASRPPHIPQALYDPSTQLRIIDPVVSATGDSFERSTLTRQQANDTVASATPEFSSVGYYPNRALKVILKQQYEYEQRQEQLLLEASGKTVTEHDDGQSSGTPMQNLARYARLNDNAHHDGEGNNALVSRGRWYYAPLGEWNNNTPLPDGAFCCPITLNVMVDPWIGPDGHTYEYNAICEWLATYGDSPVTRESMSLTQLRPNHAIYELIQYEVNCEERWTYYNPTRSRGANVEWRRHASIQAWIDSTTCTQRPTTRPNHVVESSGPFLPLTPSWSEEHEQVGSEDPPTAAASPSLPVYHTEPCCANYGPNCCCLYVIVFFVCWVLGLIGKPASWQPYIFPFVFVSFFVMFFSMAHWISCRRR
jgi:U-box domain